MDNERKYPFGNSFRRTASHTGKLCVDTGKEIMKGFYIILEMKGLGTHNNE